MKLSASVPVPWDGTLNSQWGCKWLLSNGNMFSGATQIMRYSLSTSSHETSGLLPMDRVKSLVENWVSYRSRNIWRSRNAVGSLKWHKTSQESLQLISIFTTHEWPGGGELVGMDGSHGPEWASEKRSGTSWQKGGCLGRIISLDCLGWGFRHAW